MPDNENTEKFIASYPQFCSTPVEQISNALAHATLITPADPWGTKQLLGIYLYTAHLLTANWQQLTQIASDATAIASGGKASGGSGGASEDLDQTIHGKQYKQLRSTIPATGFNF
jgi:hypothetical protein